MASWRLRVRGSGRVLTPGGQGRGARVHLWKGRSARSSGASFALGAEMTNASANGGPPEAEELTGYASLATVFATGTALLLAVLSREKRLPRYWTVRDLAMTGIATSRLARLATRDRVTMPLRAPFTSYEGTRGAGEVSESPRGRGLRRAIGRLLTCPYCATPWLTVASLGALALRPRTTRFIQAMLVSATLSDFVQQLYAASRKLDR